MSERDQVIAELQYMKRDVLEGSDKDITLDKAIALLKEQGPVEPIPPKDESDLWRCGNCNNQLFRCTHQRYCEMCGKKVKWNEREMR